MLIFALDDCSQFHIKFKPVHHTDMLQAVSQRTWAFSSYMSLFCSNTHTSPCGRMHIFSWYKPLNFKQWYVMSKLRILKYSRRWTTFQTPQSNLQDITREERALVRKRLLMRGKRNIKMKHVIFLICFL